MNQQMMSINNLYRQYMNRNPSTSTRSGPARFTTGPANAKANADPARLLWQRFLEMPGDRVFSRVRKAVPVSSLQPKL